MLNPLALSRGHHYLENALRLALLAELAYRDDPAAGLAPFADRYRQIQPFRQGGTFGFVASDEHNLVLALRGTDQVIDWVTNLRAAQTEGLDGKVHVGFWQSLGLVWDEMLARVERLRDRRQTVWITGHSLGGALATIAAARLHQQGIEPYMTCTFGAPRVFSPRAANRFLPRLYRFVNKGDVVPCVPPPISFPWCRYQHAGSLTICLDKDREASTSTPDIPQLVEFVRWLLSPSIDWRQNVTQRLVDHAMKTYIDLIRAELGQETVARLEADEPAILPMPSRIKPRRTARAA